jgi:hypothetical protein
MPVGISFRGGIIFSATKGMPFFQSPERSPLFRLIQHGIISPGGLNNNATAQKNKPVKLTCSFIHILKARPLNLLTDSPFGSFKRKKENLHNKSSFFLKKRHRFHFTIIASPAPGLNFTTLRAEMSIGFFVLGLTPLRAAFSTTEKAPNPKMDTFSPSLTALSIVLMKASTAFFASTLEIPALDATAPIKSVLFIENKNFN